MTLRSSANGTTMESPNKGNITPRARISPTRVQPAVALGAGAQCRRRRTRPSRAAGGPACRCARSSADSPSTAVRRVRAVRGPAPPPPPAAPAGPALRDPRTRRRRPCHVRRGAACASAVDGSAFSRARRARSPVLLMNPSWVTAGGLIHWRTALRLPPQNWVHGRPLTSRNKGTSADHYRDTSAKQGPASKGDRTPRPPR